MKIQKTPIASAIALVLMSASVAARADATPAPAAEAAADAADAAQKKKTAETTQLEEVVVTGIGASLARSLEVKREADSVVEVVTSEDVGKMPDKNVADSLQRVTGVTISSASASEGGFDEADRVSLRGTNPSLTQTLIDGHMVGSGDWFVLNQVGTVGRSVSYSLLPSELVSQIVVHKSATADQIEGGVAGTVDIQTRKPLYFADQFTALAEGGVVYADLPDKTDPQFNALVNWKNDSNTFGVMLQGFREERHLRRDGQETLGYGQIAPGSAIATAHPDLSGVFFPNVIGSALFEQERKRTGGMVDVQFKPSEDWTFNVSGFSSKLDATNYNRNYLVWITHVLNGGAGQAPNAGYVVRNNTLVSASFDTIPGKQYAIDDQIYRPGSKSSTRFIDVSAEWHATDALTFNAKAGRSDGKGDTPEQAVFEGDILNTGASYTLHGTNHPADAAVPNGNPAVFTGTTLDWIFGASPAKTDDEEKWGQIDGAFAIDHGALTNLKFGARAANHSRSSDFVAQGPNFATDPFNVANLPAWNGETYPGDYGDNLGGGNFPRNVWQLSPGVLRAWADAHANRDPAVREYFPGEFALDEQARAAYAMLDFNGGNWSGNVGVRYVRTTEHVLQNVPIPGDVCAALATSCSVPGAITTSAFGAFYRNPVDNTYNDWLPSANLKVDLSPELVARFAVARTMARPDYSALGGAVSLNDTLSTGQGGNPNLKPIRSNNFDAGLEWYFAEKSLLAAGLYYMDLTSYVSYGVSNQSYLNIKTGQDQVYSITSPINTSGKVRGFEFSYEQPLAWGFGVAANYTYADADAKKVAPTDTGELVGASKNTYNLVGYWENDRWNVRLAYTYRSSFFNGLDRSSAQHQDSVGTLAGSVGYTVNDMFSVSFDALNLNDPVLKYYADNRSQPTAFYSNGRQYYLTLRVKF